MLPPLFLPAKPRTSTAPPTPKPTICPGNTFELSTLRLKRMQGISLPILRRSIESALDPLSSYPTKTSMVGTPRYCLTWCPLLSLTRGRMGSMKLAMASVAALSASRELFLYANLAIDTSLVELVLMKCFPRRGAAGLAWDPSAGR